MTDGIQRQVGDVTVTTVIQSVSARSAGALIPAATAEALAGLGDGLRPWAVTEDPGAPGGR